MRNVLLDALEDRYQAIISEADATIKIYLEHPVGIGEHPQHFEEMDKLVESMTAARDKLEVLNKEYPDAIRLAE